MLREDRKPVSASPPVRGIVLAGGKSRRMGRDKALIDLHGKALIHLAVESLTSVTESCVVVAGSSIDYLVPNSETIADLMPESGPLGGIYTAMVHGGEGVYVVIGCDMPAVKPEVLRMLVRSLGPEDDAVAVEVDGVLQPLCAVYAYRSLEKIKRYLEAGSRSAKGALLAMRTRIIDAAVIRTVDLDLTSFMNVNTPDDLTRIASRLEL